MLWDGFEARATRAPDFDSYGLGGGFKPVGSEGDSKDLEDALAWLRGRRAGGDDDDKFEGLGKILPKKEVQDATGCAPDMEDALAWLRKQRLDLDEDDTPVDSFYTLGIVPTGLRSQEDRDADRLDEFLPRKQGQGPKARATDMESVLAWLRANGVNVDDEDGMPSFDKIGGVSVVTRKRVML